jgi:hypothetical protein
MTSAR